MGVRCGRVWPGGVGERGGSGGVEGIVVREVIGHMLAAAMARGDWSGASGGVGPAKRARRRRRNWQVVAWSSNEEERYTLTQSVQTERPLEERSGGPEGGLRKSRILWWALIWLRESLAVGRWTVHGTLPEKGQWWLCFGRWDGGGMGGRMGGGLGVGEVKVKERGILSGRRGRLSMRVVRPGCVPAMKGGDPSAEEEHTGQARAA